MKIRISLIIFLFHWINYINASPTMTTLDLNKNWEFRQVGTPDWLPAQVPGTIHTDLLNNGEIEDPFFRTNEKDLQWIDKVDWEYQTTFQITEELLAKDQLELVFEGLDTYTSIFLNGNLILETDNFYIPYTVDIKPELQLGDNQLKIHFHSPIQLGLALLKNNGYALPAINDQAANGGLKEKEKVSVFTRKPGYHYGWDWGPRLVASGIWRPIKLVAWEKAKIEDLYFKQLAISEESAELEAVFEIKAKQEGYINLSVWDMGRKIAEDTVNLKPGTQKVVLPFEIDQPKLWWTKELGKPHLYQLKGQLEWSGQVLEEQESKIGLRTIKVVQTPDDKGSSFYFELNGVPVFAKGANYIPNDVFIPRVDDAKYRYIIGSAAKANMNMLRVWGGGFYEQDVFYDLCDEMGILVWQDFMFACSMYPGDAGFLEKVEAEAIYNVKRLRNHPSIAIWCGNNEIDFAWQQYKEFGGWGWKQRYGKQKRNRIWEDYERVFHELLPKVVEQWHPEIFYWPSSPMAGPREHANDKSTKGDIHYWGVWHGKEPFSAFQENIGRFMSEYGFQSFPVFESVKKYTISEDWDIESEVMAAHQRSGIGNLRIRSYMEDHFIVPERFDHLLYVGQLLQAKGIRSGIEAHRIAKPYCMGTLYWQLNDCWPVASWSSIDYYGNWKALQYQAKEAFEPVIVTGRKVKDQIEVFVVSDQLNLIDGIIRMRWIDFQGNLKWYHSTPFQVLPNTSNKVGDFPIRPLELANGLDNGVLILELLKNDSLISSKQLYLEKEKELALPENPNISYTIEKVENHFEINIVSTHLAKSIYLSVDSILGFFSNNFFDLLPNVPQKVVFEPNDERVAKIETLNIVHLVETT